MKKILAFILALLIPTAASAATLKEDVGPWRYETNVETVVFGRYDQDNNEDNGPEPIRWMILEEKDGKRLMIAKDLLEQKRYNQTYGPITWAECTLRTWLNDEFLKTAFTEEEQAAILLTDVDNSDEQGNPQYRNTTSGEDTQDRIFLLSYKEAMTYFPDTPSKRSTPTDHAAANGVRVDRAYKVDGRGCGMWWLRSAGPHQWRASMAYAPGTMRYTFATRDFVGVRPVMWVDISKLPESTEE